MNRAEPQFLCFLGHTTRAFLLSGPGERSKAAFYD